MGARNIVFSTGEYYHIYSRGVEKRDIFFHTTDYNRFVLLLYTANSSEPVHLSNCKDKSFLEISRGKTKTIVDIGAWCAMPNHFHLLLKEKHENGISRFMQKLLTGYSMYFNLKFDRSGSLFQRKFSAKHLDSDEYLKYQYAYIHLNPVALIDKGWKKKHIKDKKLASDFLYSYPFSSFLDYVGDREQSVILQKDAFPHYFQSFLDFD